MTARQSRIVAQRRHSAVHNAAMSISRPLLLQTFDTLLEPERFQDYGPNGLQVEGKLHIERLVSGVTASAALIDAAIAARADAIFVHHGLFWRGQDACVTGWIKQRLQRLLTHDINLFAYHLPLDAHPQWGNNAQLGVELGWQASGHFGEQGLGCLADVAYADSAQLVAQIERVLGRSAMAIHAHSGPITRIAWCTGGAQNYLEAAARAGAQVFITGEISEPQVHLAREMGVGFVAAGHHATERYGAPALAAHVAQQLGITHEFIEINNPA